MSNVTNELPVDEPDLFTRMRARGLIRMDDPGYGHVRQVVERILRLITELNATTTSLEQTRERLSALIGQPIDSSTRVFAPFYTNFGRFIRLGKNVFINHAYSFLDMGGITLESDRSRGRSPKRMMYRSALKSI